MKNLILSLGLLGLSILHAQAGPSCSANCPDGSSCSVSGTNYVECCCVSTNNPGNQATCTNGFAVSHDGRTPTDPDFEFNPLPRAKVFSILPN